MDKKKVFLFCFVALSVSVLLSAALVLGSVFSNNPSFAFYPSRSYSSYNIELTCNNDIKNGVTNSRGNHFDFDSSNTSGGSTNIVIAENGYFYNTTKLSGIKSLVLSSALTSNIDLWYGQNEGGTIVWYDTIDSSNEYSYDLSNINPGYLKIAAKSNITLTSVTFNYICNDSEYVNRHHVSFSGLGVNSTLYTIEGEGLQGDVPTPIYDLYNTTYSTGASINYADLTSDATVEYSLVTNNASYNNLTNRITLYKSSYTKMWNTTGSFSISANFTAAKGDIGDYIESKLGFYIVDNNDTWLGIDLFGNKVINFVDSSGVMGWNSDGQGLFDDLNDVYSEDNPNFTFKLVYDNLSNCLTFVFNEGTANEQIRFTYVDRINEFANKTFDFSSCEIGLFNHSWGANSSEAGNIICEKGSAALTTNYTRNYGTETKGSGDSKTYRERIYSSSTFEFEATFNSEWDKPGLSVTDKNGEAFVFTSWNNPGFYLYDDANYGVDLSTCNAIHFEATSTVKDSSHKKMKMLVAYDSLNEIFYFKVDCIFDTGVYTNTQLFYAYLSDIRGVTGVNYDFSYLQYGILIHSWGSHTTYSDITTTVNSGIVGDIIDNLSSATNNGEFVFVGNGYDYMKESSSSLYLKTNLNITSGSQGITIYVGDGTYNAQIMFQNYGYRIYKDYEESPAVGDNGYEFNGDTGAGRVAMFDFLTATNGEHIIEYYIIGGNLYITYDGTNCFDKVLDLSEINSNFTDDAEYHIGVYNLGETKLKATIEEFAYGDDARSEYVKSIPTNGVDKNSDSSYTITDYNGKYITNYATGSFTVSAHFAQSVDYTVNGFYLIDNKGDNVQFQIWGNSNDCWVNQNNSGFDGISGLLDEGKEFDFTLAFNADTQIFTITKTVNGLSKSVNVNVTYLNDRYDLTYDFSKCYVGIASNNEFGYGPPWGSNGNTTITNYCFTDN